MQTLTKLALATSLGLALVACKDDNKNTTNDKTHTLNLSTSLAPSDPIYKGLEGFKKSVEEKSGGKIAIKLYPSGQMGADNDLIQQAQSGANVGIIVDSARLTSYVPEFGIVPAPYIFADYAQQREFVLSDTFANWTGKLGEAANLTPLSFNWYQGGRSLATNKEVKTPDDLKGVKVRALEAPVTIETVRCLGGEPTPLSWSEIYSSLQAGIVDAAEAQPTALYGSKLHEVVQYITPTKHIHLMTGVVVSNKWLNSLPEDLQKLLKEESQAFGDSASEATLVAEEEMLAKMQEEGKKVVILDTDITPFKEACAYVPEKLGLQDAFAQVQAVINNEAATEAVEEVVEEVVEEAKAE